LITFISKLLLPSKKWTYLCKKQDFADDNDGQMASIADDDIFENEHHHWQTDVFNNMKIDKVHRKKIMWPAISVYSEINNYLYYKCHYS